jgi:hypothetical protein
MSPMDGARSMPVLFREEPCVPREHTIAGVRLAPRRPRRFDLFAQLLAGPFLAAFDAGIGDPDAP